MNQIAKNTRRTTITLALPKSVPGLISYAQTIVKRMTANPNFPNPNPPLAALTAAIDELQTAQTGALSRTKGAVVLRNEKRTALIGVLHALRAYIQTIADKDATNAASVIESAGVTVRKTPTRRARAFTVKQGPVSGGVKMIAQVAARRASYEWEYSIDGGKTWLTAPPTLQAKTTVAGLAPGATVLFKYRSVVRGGASDWSQPVSLLVQ